jgi:hypothetical protein
MSWDPPGIDHYFVAMIDPEGDDFDVACGAL